MTDNISGKTRVCGLIGDPVEHSMSPAMHNGAFQEMGLDYVYVTFRVKPAGLEKAIAGLRELGVAGFNITIPHKINVMPLLDKIDPLAEKIGAVNTVVNENGIMTGYNTDASGFIQAMVDKGVEPAGKDIIVLGAGGASRAVTFSLAERKASVTILNRASGLERAKILATAVAEKTGSTVTARELNDANLKELLSDAAILVNTTSVGMSPDNNSSPVPAALLRPGLVVYDIVYNPVQTRLLRDAQGMKATIITGVDMLVWQGVTAFEKWTGKQPSAGLMKQKVLTMLK